MPGNWTLAFDDEFNGTAVSSSWINTLWGLTNGTSPSNVNESNGLLTLTATNSGGTYTGAQVSTGGNLAAGGSVAPGFSFLYGYAEASIQMPAGQGLWPAFWMLPTPDPGYHDGDGEVDITEFLGSQLDTDQVHLHHTGYTTAGAAYNTGDNLSAGFHTYAINWQPGSLTFYFDGQVALTATGSIVPDVAEYLILDLWVGTPGSWPGVPNSSTVFPANMQVDWARVWQSTTTTSNASNLEMIAPPTNPIGTAPAADSLVTQLAGSGSATYSFADSAIALSSGSSSADLIL